MNTRFTFYCHTNRVNGKRYVGQTVDTMEGRWKDHVSAARQDRGSRIFGAAIRKYGPEAFDHEVLEVVETTQKDADDIETKWIKEKQSRAPNGYNLMAGGGGNGHHHEDSKRLIGETTRVNWANLTPEARAERVRNAKEGGIKAGPLRSERMSVWQTSQAKLRTPEQRSEMVRKCWATRRALYGQDGAKQAKTSEEYGEATRKGWSNMTLEARAERVRKTVEAIRQASLARFRLESFDEEMAKFARHWSRRGHSIESIAYAFGVPNHTIESAVA